MLMQAERLLALIAHQNVPISLTLLQGSEEEKQRARQGRAAGHPQAASLPRCSVLRQPLFSVGNLSHVCPCPGTWLFLDPGETEARPMAVGSQDGFLSRFSRVSLLGSSFLPSFLVSLANTGTCLVRYD